MNSKQAQNELNECLRTDPEPNSNQKDACFQYQTFSENPNLKIHQFDIDYANTLTTTMPKMMLHQMSNSRISQGTNQYSNSNQERYFGSRLE